jgi:tRNA threonylcarbamoyladenosine biosynthesis protein TsaE
VKQLVLADVAAMETLGRQLAPAMQRGIVYLEGELGTGKTTLARAILHGRGYKGKVRSPTYTLVEPYCIGDDLVYHLDLYRISDPEELEWLGLRDLLAEPALLLIEWPERGAGSLPGADLRIEIAYRETGRVVNLYPQTVPGQAMVESTESR